MRRETATTAVLLALALTAGAAHATYSPPLTRVRIDADRFTQSPELVFASDLRDEGPFSAEARVLGAQYIAQLEWQSGFGLQLGAAVAHASVDVAVGRDLFDDIDAVFVGGQARAYYMLWTMPAGERAHALTAFVNLRLAQYWAPDGHLSSTALGAGVGAMAEIALSDYVSICPYAWLTPGLYSRYDFREAAVARADEKGPGFKTPLQFGMDVWIYPAGGRGDDHLSLSVIASLIDTSANGSRTVSGVVGWTF